jgi:membrane fusion protein (multidrug efflux system)
VAILEARALAAEARSRHSDLKLAEQRLADTTVRAPALSASATRPATRPGGRFGVSARLVSVGEYVRESTPLFKLVADNPLKYRASVPEKFSRQVQPGQKVDLYVEGQSEPFVGTLARVNPQVDPATRTFQIEAIVPNDHGQLRPGSFARGYIHTSVDPSVTFAPAGSVISFAGVSKIFTVKEGKAVEARVKTGARRGEWVEIVSGLKGEQQVVTEGAAKLANGVPVTVQTPATAEATTRPAVADSK